MPKDALRSGIGLPPKRRLPITPIFQHLDYDSSSRLNRVRQTFINFPSEHPKIIAATELTLGTVFAVLAGEIINHSQISGAALYLLAS